MTVHHYHSQHQHAKETNNSKPSINAHGQLAMRKETRSIYSRRRRTRRPRTLHRTATITTTTANTRSPLTRSRRYGSLAIHARRTQQGRTGTRGSRRLRLGPSGKGTRISALILTDIILVGDKRELIFRIAARVRAVIALGGVSRDAGAVLLVCTADVVEVVGVGVLVVGSICALEAVEHAGAELRVDCWR